MVEKEWISFWFLNLLGTSVVENVLLFSLLAWNVEHNFCNLFCRGNQLEISHRDIRFGFQNYPFASFPLVGKYFHS